MNPLTALALSELLSLPVEGRRDLSAAVVICSVLTGVQ